MEIKKEDLPKISKQQNKFVELCFKNYLPCDAYIEAYNSDAKRSTAYVEASRLLKNPKITLWFEYFKQNMTDYINREIKYSLEDAFNEFEEMKLIALSCKDKNGNPNVQAAIKAIEIKCKLKGYMKDDVNMSNAVVMQMGDVELGGVPLDLNIGENPENVDRSTDNTKNNNELQTP